MIPEADLEAIIEKYFFSKNELEGSQSKTKVEKKVNKKFVKKVKEQLGIEFKDFVNFIQRDQTSSQKEPGKRVNVS